MKWNVHNERSETSFHLIAIPRRCVSPPDFNAVGTAKYLVKVRFGDTRDAEKAYLVIPELLASSWEKREL